MSHEVVTLGEALLRLWVPAGERLETAPSFRVTVAGSEANVAMAIARMGARSAWLSALPDNPLGRRAAVEVARHGVDTANVVWQPQARMGLFFVELSMPPRPITVLYDRAGSAMAAMGKDDVAWPVVEGARIFHISGITPALSPGTRRLAQEAVERASAAGALVSIDVNYRRSLWSEADCRETISEMVAHTDLLISTIEDARDVFGLNGSCEEVARRLQDLAGVSTVVVTAGADGAGWLQNDRFGFVPGYPATALDRIGAGDAFAAGALLGVLSGDLEHGIEQGLAMASLKMGILGDPLSITPEEVEGLMGGTDREVAR